MSDAVLSSLLHRLSRCLEQSHPDVQEMDVIVAEFRIYDAQHPDYFSTASKTAMREATRQLDLVFGRFSS